MLWAGLAWSVYRLAAGWTVRGSDPGGGEIFCNRQDGCEAYPASYTVGTGAWRGVNHPPLSSTEVKERVGLQLCISSGLSWTFSRVKFTFTFFYLLM